MPLRHVFKDPALNEALRDVYQFIDRFRSRRRAVVEGVVIRTTETVIPHGIGREPKDVHFVLYGDARVWINAKDKDKVYALASAEVTADVIIEG